MIEEEKLREESKLAVLYFKSNEYTKALQLFNRLIFQLKQLTPTEIKQIRSNHYNLAKVPKFGELVHPKLSTLLDQKASCLEKLDKHNLALKESKLILKYEPFNVKGYLRIGKILYLLNQKFEAYKNYQTGIYILRSLREKNKKEDVDQILNSQANLTEKLKSQYKLLNQELKLEKEKKSVPNDSILRSITSSASSSQDSQQRKKRKVVKQNIDPFNQLPIEIVNEIVKQLSMIEKFNCLLTCKQWYNNLNKLQIFDFKCKNNITLDEFNVGLKFFKKNVSNTNLKIIKNLKINQVYDSKILHVISLLVKENQIHLGSLDLKDLKLNLQDFFYALYKNGWRLNNFKYMEELNLGINCSMKSSQILVNIFPNLKRLKIVVFIPEKSSLQNLPVNDKIFNKYKSLVLEDYPNLEELVLINHPKLLNSTTMRISNETYSPFPPSLISRSFSQLKDLTIVSFDLSNHLPILGESLINCKQLQKLYLENNEGLNLITLLQMFLNYKPNFKLLNFTFREVKVDNILNLQELGNIVLIPELSLLQHLDLYRNNLSHFGLIRLLKMCSTTLLSLNLGHSTYLDFSIKNQTNHFHPKQHQMQLHDILKLCSNLTTLYLNELNIDTIGIMNIIKQFENLNFEKQRSINLDLSFNQIDGIDLLKLLNYLNSKNLIKLNILDINGLSISEDTMNFILRKRLVSKINFDQNRIKWLQYGVNSLIVA
ncbi:DIA2 [Candida pseudojiufengensis]|uniref:DIA2 n=1 Tax=Candida pseudojiufengensis TaxID=497109 RepID=UPI002224764F|nr:DIA2 [Candida pseudojiufengensis]KAI5959048.1 DIA2 [Candida pseudojiufengensis]